MNRRFFVSSCVLPTILLLTVSLTGAQQVGKVYRIGWLRSSKTPPTSSSHEAFRRGLREFGFVEGRNVVIDYRSVKGKTERYPKLATELVQSNVDVIVTSPGPIPVRAARHATRTIPIVMAGVQVDPVKAGFIASLARPGGNVTGITNLDSELQPKRLELLKGTFPQISRAAILWPKFQEIQAMKAVEATGQGLGIQVQSLASSRPPWDKYLESAFSEIGREGADALLVAHPLLIHQHRARIIEFMTERRLPTIFPAGRFMKPDGLMSYGADQAELFHQTATYVAKILKGAKPADLPVGRPRKFELMINLKMARKLGFTIPPEVLLQADKVIK